MRNALLHLLNRTRLYVLLTESECAHPWEATARAALEGGAHAIQLREKHLSDRELLRRARWLRALTREFGALLLLNDRPDVALLSDADGAHLGQDELPVADARRIVGPERLVGVSTHNMPQARQAVADGADYLGIGPVFPSGTKEFAELAGLEFVREAAREIALPVLAIGGITPDNLSLVLAAGAQRIAVCGAVCRAGDARAAAARLLEALGRASGP